MKKFVKVLATSALALSFAAVSAMADKPVPEGDDTYNGNGMPSGKHFQIELIGHPGNDSDVLGGAADKSNGRAIMIPLSNAGKKTSELYCEGTTLLTDDEQATWTQTIPNGTKIYFTGSPDGYAILDRDATDGDGAKIQLQTIVLNEDTVDETETRAFDVYVRILGKPNTCMNIGAYALDEANQVWFSAGTLDLHRNTGKSITEDANKLFTVNWCDPGDATSGTCSKQDSVEYSVFDAIFSEYVWNVNNTGVRNVQVRFYPRTDGLTTP